MSNNKKLVYSVIKFLKSELSTLSPEACESIEVAIQCLENAYEIHTDSSELDTGASLPEIFGAYLSSVKKRPPTDAEKEEAERLKTEGNNLMKAEKFKEALDCYTRAIELNPNSHVYYCNRAAAHSRLNNHQATIDDCKAALQIEPSYSKAYGRLGLAYSSLNMFNEAKVNYEKALELEPDNPLYINNLELNEERARSATSGAVNGMPREDQFNFNALLGSPSIMSMASQMLSDPTMLNVMSSLMSGNIAENSSGMEAFLQAGQRLAQHMQNANPDLVEQLRQQVSNAAAGQHQQNPPPNKD